MLIGMATELPKAKTRRASRVLVILSHFLQPEVSKNISCETSVQNYTWLDLLPFGIFFFATMSENVVYKTKLEWFIDVTRKVRKNSLIRFKTREVSDFESQR